MDSQHVGTAKMLNSNQTNVNKIDKSVFQSFNQITDPNETVRLKGSLQLLQNLVKKDDQNPNEYQLKYALKRLIRGVGSSTSASRSAFFTTLVGYLKLIDNVNFSDVFEITQKELQIGGSIDQDKIDTHANTGRILVCGALIQSGKISQADNEDLKTIIEMLVKSSKVKKFHRSLSYIFLGDIMKMLTTAKLNKIMLPALQDELAKPWAKQNLETLHFLLLIEDTHSSALVKFCNKYLNTSQVFCQDSYAQFAQILLHDKNVLNVNHPIYEYLSCKIANSRDLFVFWEKYIDPRIKETTKLKEVCTIKMLTTIFQNSTQKVSAMSKLLTNNVVIKMVDTFQHKKLKNNFVIDFYRELFSAIIDYLKRVKLNDENSGGGGFKIIQRLITSNGGYLMFDRLTSSDLIANIVSILTAAEINAMVEHMKTIVLSETLNSEKLFALQMIVKLTCHPCVVGDLEWRIEQIMFGLNLANFKTKDGYKMVKETSEDVAESIPQLNLKQQFYHSLQTKFKSLEDERNVLMHLIQHVKDVMTGKHGVKYMKSTLSVDGHRVFNEMFEEVTSKTSSGKFKNKLDLVFSVLLLHMGLQLFNDEKLAISAIDELKLCMRRVKSKTNKRKSVANDEDGPEPEWIEVVVDLFLHLLSQNSSLLRNIINKVFPQLCPFLTMDAVHQILSLLDMTVENPLSADNEADDEEQDNANEEETSEKEDDEESSDDDDEEEKIDDDDEDEEDSMMGEEGNVSDQLRSAVRLALGGAAPESDLESIDLDDMDDKDAQRLDNALSAAFKMYSENRSNKRNKKSKKEKAVETTVIHFRLRVLDLVDIYVKTEPKMSFVIEIMVTLYDMLNFCVKDGGPLLTKVENILNKITDIKHFTDSSDVTAENLEGILKNLTEKKFTSFAVAQRNLYLAKCVVFIINCTKLLKPSKSSAITIILSQYLDEFMVSRNPVLPFNIFMAIFGLVWNGIWDLSLILVNKGIKEKMVQSIRRTQIITLISKLFRNHQFLLVDVKISQKQLNYIETEMSEAIRDYAKNFTLTQKVFGELLDLLIEINKCHTRIQTISCKFNWTELNQEIQKIRQMITLESSLKTYRKYCQIMKLEFIKNQEKNDQVKNGNGSLVTNGHVTTSKDAEVSSEEENTVVKNGVHESDDDDDSVTTKTTKRKQSPENFIKLKKQKKMDARAKFSSKGLNGGLSFMNLSVDNDETTPQKLVKKMTSTTGTNKNKLKIKSKMKKSVKA